MAEQHLYDLIIVGAGPAGLSAGLYAGRATLDTLILEGDTVGGQVTTTSVVYNYPAVEKVDGTQLMNQIQSQVASFGVGHGLCGLYGFLYRLCQNSFSSLP